MFNKINVHSINVLSSYDLQKYQFLIVLFVSVAGMCVSHSMAGYERKLGEIT